jgi:hypothetical protein
LKLSLVISVVGIFSAYPNFWAPENGHSEPFAQSPS